MDDELEGFPVVDVVADIFFVGENLVHRPAGPKPAKIRAQLIGIEPACDLSLIQAFLKKAPIYPLDYLNFIFGAGAKHDAIRLKAFMLPAFQFRLERAGLIKQHTAQAKACGAALAKAEFDQAALASENLGG